jgi:hypothetical protein
LRAQFETRQEFFKIPHEQFLQEHAAQITAAAKSELAQLDADDDAREREDDEVLVEEEEEEPEVDDVATARSQGPESMFQLANTKLWRSKSRHEIAKAKVLLLGEVVSD